MARYGPWQGTARVQSVDDGNRQVAGGEGEKHPDDGLQQRQLAEKSHAVGGAAGDIQSTPPVQGRDSEGQGHVEGHGQYKYKE